MACEHDCCRGDGGSAVEEESDDSDTESGVVSLTKGVLMGKMLTMPKGKPGQTILTLLCDQCHVEYSVTQRERPRGVKHFCSIKCRNDFYRPIFSQERQGKGNPCYRHGKSRKSQFYWNDKTGPAWLASRKLKKKPCSVCGEPLAHAHHPDYAKPTEVVWLCPLHHRQEHKRLREVSKK